MAKRIPKEERAGRHIPLVIKRRIWEMPCVICGHFGLTCVDHITPVAIGGASTEENLQPLCIQCNAKKADRLTNEQLIEWFESRREEHSDRNEYIVATRYMNPFDAPSFYVWQHARKAK